MKNDVKAVVAAAIFLTLMFSVVTIDLRGLASGAGPRVQTVRGWEMGPQAPESPVAVAQYMFGPYAVALIILSVLLLVALVGALVLAKPERTEDEA